MLKRFALLSLVVFIAACLGAMGIGEVAMLKFVLAFSLMSFAAVLLSWLFLRKSSTAKDL